MDNLTESSPPNRKQAKKAAKRRKLEALIRITALNNQDKQKLSSHVEPPVDVDNHDESKRVIKEEDNCSLLETLSASNEEPSAKRHKPDNTNADDEEIPVVVASSPSKSLDPRNISIRKQPPVFPSSSGTYSQYPNAETLAASNCWPNHFHQEFAAQHSKPPFLPLINGFSPLPFNVPALLVPNVWNIPAFLENFPSQSAGSYSNPPPIAFLPMACGYQFVKPFPFHGPFLCPDPTIHNHAAPTAGNPPPVDATDNVDGDLRILRKSLKTYIKERKATPEFCLSITGDTASLSTREEDRVPIFTNDIQRLLLRATLGGDTHVQTRCGKFKHVNQITGIKLLLLEGLCLKDMQRCPELFALLAEIFPIQMECVMPTAYEGALLEELVAVPLSNSDRKSLIRKYGSLEVALRMSKVFRVLRAFFPIRHEDNDSSALKPAESKTENDGEHEEAAISPESDQFPRTHLLMSAWQMIEESYPLPIKGSIFKQFQGFGFTKEEYQEVTPSSPMYGLDCEMCLTTLKKHELTRVSIVNEKHELIYDTLVKPPNEIINYLTEFSGITKRMMRGVKTTLKEVQEKLRTILEPDAILVGQSLNSDLVALQLMHPYVIDTSIVFNLSGNRCRKSKLKYLAKAFLHLDIQNDSTAGHDPVEDAGTALKLVQLKLSKSLEFGDAVLSQLRDVPFSIPEMEEQENAGEKKKKSPTGKKERTNEHQSKDDNFACSVFRYLNRQTVNIIANPEVVDEYHKYTYVQKKGQDLHRPNISRGQDEREIVDKAVQYMNDSFCTIAHARLGSHVAELLSIKDEETTERFKTIINDFQRAAPINSIVLLVLGGNSDGQTGAVYLKTCKNTFTKTRS